MESVAIELSDLTKRFGSLTVVNAITLRLEPGLLYVFLGPSGCGKTTTLRMIAGLESLTAGRICIGSEDVSDVPPYRRDLGLVFQNYALFPHLSVADNVAFGLRIRRMDRAAISQRVEEALRQVRLVGLETRRPRQLSGGQQQRVALARALVTRPRALLLDEPLSNLDKNLRDEMRLQIRDLQRDLGITTAMVTHDQEEALSMADRVVVMHDGKIEQLGTPEDIFRRPATTFVARFIGAANIIAGRITEQRLFIAADDLKIPVGDHPVGRSGHIVVRPSDVRLTPYRSGQGALRGTVVGTQYLGSTRRVTVALLKGIELTADIGADQELGLERGQPLSISWASGSEHFLPGGDH